MCTMAILYRVARGTPILVAANREERFDRPTQYPKIQSGSPRVVCGIDRKAGGTWLGVNQFGLFCAVLNRRRADVPRGAAVARACCAANCSTADRQGCGRPRRQGLGHGQLRRGELRLRRCAARLCGPRRQQAGDRRACTRPARHHQRRRRRSRRTSGTSLSAGCSLCKRLDSAVTFLAVASRVFSRKPDQRGAARRGHHRRRFRHGFVHAACRCRGRSSTPSINMPPPRPAIAPTTTSPPCCGRCSPPSAAGRTAKADGQSVKHHDGAKTKVLAGKSREKETAKRHK